MIEGMSLKSSKLFKDMPSKWERTFLSKRLCTSDKNLKCIKGEPNSASKAFRNFKQAAITVEFSGNITFKAIYMQMCDKWQCTEGLEN